MITVGFDTSNYTTSCACFDGTSGDTVSRLLPVKAGELGLRQSDALFSHIKRLPELSDRLFAHIRTNEIRAIGVSTRPRPVEGSYMPCFLAGESHASVLAAALHVPLYRFSHQEGHIAAVLWSAGKLELLGTTFLAWHLSGGTTELLLVHSESDGMRCEKIGGTTDISAGQLIDRTGKLLGLNFPAGRELDTLSCQCDTSEWFPVKVNGCSFSLSGVENKVCAFHEKNRSPAETARYALGSVVGAVKRATQQALERYPCPVVFSGGVSSNGLLRQAMMPLGGIFSEPRFSTDNAMGIAVLTWLQEA